MRQIMAEPLTAEAFAPFGEVIEAPAGPGRRQFGDRLANERNDARPRIGMSRVAPHPGGPVEVREMERHAFSSQSFVALSASRWLVGVAPHGADGGPDTSRLAAFIAGPGQGITFAADVWHLPMTVFDEEALFTVFMWRDGTAGDEEFVDVDPVTIMVPEKVALA